MKKQYFSVVFNNRHYHSFNGTMTFLDNKTNSAKSKYSNRIILADIYDKLSRIYDKISRNYDSFDFDNEVVVRNNELTIRIILDHIQHRNIALQNKK